MSETTEHETDNEFTRERCFEIAQGRGLGLSDARALWKLSDSEEEAEALAGQFGSKDDAAVIADQVLRGA